MRNSEVRGSLSVALKATPNNFYKSQIKKIAENDKDELSPQLRAMRRLSIQKEAFMFNINEQTNHDVMLNESLPEKLEDQLQNCLIIKPSIFSDENIVKIQFFANWKKSIDKAWIPSLALYTRNDEGLFDRQDLTRIADHSTRGLGRDYHNMTAEDKKNYLSKLRSQKEFENMQKKMNLGDGANKLKQYKNEVLLMDRQREG